MTLPPAETPGITPHEAPSPARLSPLSPPLPPASPETVLVTGACGYLGQQLLIALAGEPRWRVVALDVRPPAQPLPGVHYAQCDIRDPRLSTLVAQHRPRQVVHLASIVTPGKHSNRAFEYDVDVNGTRLLLQACVQHGVHRVIVSSSGAAYGYHADNPPWLRETDALRGNEHFAYAHHKRLVEEMLADYRQRHPGLQQTIFRIGTILGPTVRNQITDLFEKPRLLAIAGSDSPFVFVHDQDVVGAIRHALLAEQGGIFNVAGDGKLTIHQIAQRLNKPCLVLPAPLLRTALWILRKLGLTQYGPEQLDFLRYRPVLLNTRLKQEFGYAPRLSSAEVFDLYCRARQGRP